jgi:hypothetical protein
MSTDKPTLSSIAAELLAEKNVAAYVSEANKIIANADADTKEEQREAVINLVEIVGEELDDVGNDLSYESVAEDTELLINKCTRGAVLLLVAASQARKNLRLSEG